MIRNYLSAILLSISLLSCDTLSNIPGAGGTSTITELEAAQGIRDALDQGVGRGINYLNKTDGFFGNEAYKLFLPAEEQRIENTLRQLGMGSMVDRAILQINRAAEDASKSAAPIFIDAVKNMSIQDALGILKGPDTAATSYLKKATTTNLTNAFKPTIDSSLKKVNATRYWSLVVDKYNSLPTTFNKVNSDLPSYVTQKALSGIFYYVADEEKKIRTNPAARVNDILKKVFGN